MFKIIKKKDVEKSVYYLQTCIENHKRLMDETEQLLEDEKLSDLVRTNLIHTRSLHAAKYFAYRDALYEFEKLGLYEP